MAKFSFEVKRRDLLSIFKQIEEFTNSVYDEHKDVHEILINFFATPSKISGCYGRCTFYIEVEDEHFCEHIKADYIEGKVNGDLCTNRNTNYEDLGEIIGYLQSIEVDVVLIENKDDGAIRISPVLGLTLRN